MAAYRATQHICQRALRNLKEQDLADSVLFPEIQATTRSSHPFPRAQIMAKYLHWQCCLERDEDFVIYPDGCRDILLVTAPDGRQRLKLADWDFSPRRVSLPAGLCITGFRMRPGLVLGENDLLLMSLDPVHIEQFICSEARCNPVLDDTIGAMVEHPYSAEALARQHGVSLRTLQRRFHELGLPAFDYWRMLGRARRAAQMLRSGQALVELAADAGYSDQAHMTREFMRWFGKTPAQLRRSPQALEYLRQPGLGNWA